MDMHAYEGFDDAAGYLSAAVGDVAALGEDLRDWGPSLPTGQAGQLVAAIEDLAKRVGYCQIIAAHLAKDLDLARLGDAPTANTDATDSDAPDADAADSASRPPAIDTVLDQGSNSSKASNLAAPSGRPGAFRGEFRDTGEYLRARLGIGRSEALRRIRLGAAISPRRQLTGAIAEPRLPVLATALASGDIDMTSASMIRTGLAAVETSATAEQHAAMEASLTQHAAEADADTLRQAVKVWVAAADPDGPEPSTAELAARQGLFYRGRRRGLHHWQLAATDAQHEALTTAADAETNPRLIPATVATSTDTGDTGHSTDTGHAEDTTRYPDNNVAAPDADVVDERTREQKLLDGLIGACRIALSTDQLPAAGGHRPQIMATIDYRDLYSDTDCTGTVSTGTNSTNGPTEESGRLGRMIHTGLASPETIRQIGCDAAITDIILGANGQVLDIGRTQRTFPIAMRRALVARDHGCAFPNCTTIATWCEAHHIAWWSRGGGTSIDNGVLLCAHHHGLIHQGHWQIHIHHGIPWFIPPSYVDPTRRPRRNRYWHAGTPPTHTTTLSATASADAGPEPPPPADPLLPR